MTALAELRTISPRSMFMGMKSRSLIPLLLCAALASTCSKDAEKTLRKGRVDQDGWLQKYLDTPQYGQLRPITGKMMIAQEMNIIGLCDNGRAGCMIPRNVDGSEQPCWLTFTERGSADLTRMSRFDPTRNSNDVDEYWIEATGRIAVQPGSFGHVHGYTCQVEISSIRKLEIGLPRFWEPPPFDRPVSDFRKPPSER